MFQGDNSIVPVVMFHSVGLERDDYWPMVNISEPLDMFREKLEILKRAGYEFWHWDELYRYMRFGGGRSKPAIMLTFDDGYLDNWVYVFPILRELGIKATIFVNPEFVDPSKETRLSYDDVRTGKISAADLDARGFLNWTEMREMEASGLVDIQSHTMTHTWYFSGSKVLDFHNPGTRKYPWLVWNHCPERKPFYLTEDQRSLIPWGIPIYEHEKALVCRRYFPPDKIKAEVLEYVRSAGDHEFFGDLNWREQLQKLHEQLMARYGRDGRYETQEEYERRVFEEIRTAKEVLERELDKKVEYLCWPGGGYNDFVKDAARKVGFKAWTLASSDATERRNGPCTDPAEVKRIGSCSRYYARTGRECGFAGELYFLSNIERHKGSAMGKGVSRVLRALAIFQAGLGSQRMGQSST